MAVPEWSRVLNTTIHRYIKEREDNVMRNRKILAMLRDRGRMIFNMSGDMLDWKVKFKRVLPSGYADMDTITFSRKENTKTAQLEWRGYTANNAWSEKEAQMNKGMEAIVKLVSDATESTMDDFEEAMGDELYIDGNASGNERRWHGIESFMANSGVQANGFVATPSDTYAGLSTVLGNYGGTWSTVSSNVDWPSGTGNTEYDFWSPILVDYTDTAWTATTKIWPNTCLEAIRFGLLKRKLNKMKKDAIDLVVLESEMFRQFLEAVGVKESLFVSRGDKKGGLVSLGFSDVVNWDGTDVTTEYGVGSNIGYGWSIGHTELCSLYPELLHPFDIIFDENTLTYRQLVANFSNLRMNPRAFFKLASYT